MSLLQEGRVIKNAERQAVISRLPRNPLYSRVGRRSTGKRGTSERATTLPSPAAQRHSSPPRPICASEPKQREKKCHSLIIQPKQMNTRVAEGGDAVDVCVADVGGGLDGRPGSMSISGVLKGEKEGRGAERGAREWRKRGSEGERYALMSHAVALMNGAALVAEAVRTSLPTLYARTLSYLEKALIVSMYCERGPKQKRARSKEGKALAQGARNLTRARRCGIN
ncbi:hypothetical protein B0H13DRAFT_1854687 [Mycena leptocephala]|nr:hypothetical protein B0H13DRAFT_1854687 [Mycena leptocephala]